MPNFFQLFSILVVTLFTSITLRGKGGAVGLYCLSLLEIGVIVYCIVHLLVWVEVFSKLVYLYFFFIYSCE